VEVAQYGEISMRSLRILALSTSLIALGCSKDSSPTDDRTDTGTSTDTGDTQPKYDEGCILVDGAGGYKWLEDAMEVAGEGSTITLCEGELALSIEIEGSLNIIGPGADLLTWTADVNKAAIKVTGGADVTLAGFTVSSTRNGIEIENSVDVTVSEITFVEVLGTGVRSIDSTNTVVDNCNFVQPPYEGGGDTGETGETGETGDSAEDTSEAPEFMETGLGDTGDTGDTGSLPYTPDPVGYGGVEVAGGDAIISNSTFVQMLGFAIHGINGGVVTASDNEIYYTWFSETDDEGNVSDGFAIWVQDGSVLNTNGNLLGDNFVGIFSDEGDLNLLGDTISGGVYGVFATNGAFFVDGLTIQNPVSLGMRLVSATDAVIVSNTTVWGDPELVASGEGMDGTSTGLLIGASEASVYDSTVYGYNYMGLQLIPYDNEISAVLNNVTIENAATMGLYCGQGDFDLTDVVVKDFRTPYDPFNEDGSSISSGFATSFWYSDVSWTGGGIYDSEFIGALAAYSTLSMDGVEVDGNLRNGLWIYESTAAISGSTFSRSSSYGGIVSSSGDVTLNGNTFTNNLEPAYSEYDSGTVVYGYLYYYQSQDIVSYSGTRLDVNNNTFVDGSESIRTVYGTNINIENNSWENYNRNVIYAYSPDDTITFKNNTGTNIGANWIYCQTADMEVIDSSVDWVTGYNYKTTYFQDGVETNTYESTYYDDAIYASGCTFYADNMNVSNSQDHVANFYDSEVEIYDSTFSNSSTQGYAAYGAIDARWSTQAPSFIGSGLSINNVDRGYGLRLSSTSSTAGLVLLTDISVDNAMLSGVRLESLTGSSVTLEDILSTNNGNSGLEASDVEASLSGLTASGNSTGLTCAGNTDFDPCENLTLSGNNQEHSGCEAACAALAGGDTGGDSGSTDSGSTDSGSTDSGASDSGGN
jgi:hypothetical protein